MESNSSCANGRTTKQLTNEKKVHVSHRYLYFCFHLSFRTHCFLTSFYTIWLFRLFVESIQYFFPRKFSLIEELEATVCRGNFFELSFIWDVIRTSCSNIKYFCETDYYHLWHYERKTFYANGKIAWKLYGDLWLTQLLLMLILSKQVSKSRIK